MGILDLVTKVKSYQVAKVKQSKSLTVTSPLSTSPGSPPLHLLSSFLALLFTPLPPLISSSTSSLYLRFTPLYHSLFLQMSNKRSNSFRRAILQGSRQLKGCSLRDEVGLGLSQRLVRHVAYETLPREVDRKWYFDSYTYCPPPWLILAITIAEVSYIE